MKGVNKLYIYKMKLKYLNFYIFLSLNKKNFILVIRQLFCFFDLVKIDLFGIKGYFYLDYICVNNGLFIINYL